MGGAFCLQARQLFDDIFGEIHRDETEALGYRASDRFGITRYRHHIALDAEVRLTERLVPHKNNLKAEGLQQLSLFESDIQK
jgi:hypothetical protein